LRPAVKSDDKFIHDLIHQVGINPMNLNWEHFIIAEDKDSIPIGCVQLKPHKDGSLELASLAVIESFRGLGVARALIEYELARSPRPLYLMCLPELENLYRKFQFDAVDLADMPPYFRRIKKFMSLVIKLTGHVGPTIMRLD
jgi:N-acetylglutamate synthase-like GNAT family acetyltransferase